MKTFDQYEYKRPNVEEAKQNFYSQLADFKEADSAEKAIAVMEKINDIRNTISTMENLVYIRASIDTTDAFYQKERDFFDETNPEFEEWTTDFYKALVASPFRDELEKRYGKQLFQLAECQIKAFSPEIIDLLKKENKLVSEYSKLIASAQIEFQEKTYTLSQIVPFYQHHDRNIRKEAVSASAGFYAANGDKLDNIYDQLVKIRHEIATTLGYKNFVEVGYLRMQRIDYDAEMVENFRKQVRETIVPLATKLHERQRMRLGLDSFKFYDEFYEFKTGNATPKGSPEWIIENGKKMYSELSDETKEFFQFMLDRNLMDLEAKKGKEVGGYCTYIADYESPFIFANFNGTSDDIDVLTHEAGHAFQTYLSRHLKVPEYEFPTSEAAEIHSMSMEFFTWPWMELFFQEDTEKYKFSHLAAGITFIPYGVLVDEFQHRVYENPDWTPEERKRAWRELEKVYLPHRDYDGIEFFESGGLWQRQLHLFDEPFYYIDYTLAQICAYQFWKRDEENHEEAWNDYVELCKLGGSRSFLELLDAANLRSPFAEGTVKSVVSSVEKWLDNVDDKAL